MSDKYEISLEGAVWRRSSFTQNGGGNCVEIAPLAEGHVGVRDSKNPTRPALVFTPGEWTAFLDGVKADEFNDLN
jgi:hypothetical protein